MANQIRNQFDEETIKKIIRGAVIAGTGAAALFILQAIGQMEFSNVALAGFVAWAVPFFTNLIREYRKGNVIETE